jgi:hypothetical protein
MKTLPIESTPTLTAFSFKSALALFGQWFGALIAFIVAMIVADMASPLPQFILEKTSAAGFMPQGAAEEHGGAVNTTILVWAARRSSLKGFALAGGLFVLSFGAQVFQTQIETAYFLDAFPLLDGNFEVYRLILRGAITSALFVLLVTLLVALSALALALLPTAQLAFANPLMPAEVSLYHFWEVAISTGIFGALCAWLVASPLDAEKR